MPLRKIRILLHYFGERKKVYPFLLLFLKKGSVAVSLVVACVCVCVASYEDASKKAMVEALGMA